MSAPLVRALDLSPATGKGGSRNPKQMSPIELTNTEESHAKPSGDVCRVITFQPEVRVQSDNPFTGARCQPGDAQNAPFLKTQVQSLPCSTKNSVPMLGNSATEIEKFIDRLRAVRAHSISVTDWDALRRGEYLVGLTEAKAKRRAPGGPGLCCDRLSDKQWEEARLAIALQTKERTLADTLDSIERERRDAHVEALIAESFATASEAHKETLTREINRYAATDRLEELQEFLGDVRTVGLSAAQSKREHGGRKALLAYALPGIAAVVEVMVALRIMGVVEAGFQTIVVSMLLILYAAIAHKIQALQYGVWFFGLDMQRSFLVAYRQLHQRYSKKNIDERTVPEAIKNLKRSAVNTLVSSCKCSILIVIALWELVKTIH